MKLLLAIFFAVCLSLYFERQRILKSFYARRNVRPIGKPISQHDHVTEAERIDSWRKNIAAVDRAALREALTILADGREEDIDYALAEVEECWQATVAKDVPASEDARTELWWNRAIDSLEERGSVIGFDWKDYGEFTQRQLMGDLRLPEALASNLLPQAAPIEDKLRHFDTELQPHGYRFVLMTSPYDDLRGKVVASDMIPRLRSLSERLRVDTGGPPPSL